jgi:cell division protein FtsB
MANREERAHERSGSGRKAALALALALLTALIAGAFFGDRGLRRLRQEERRLATLEAELDELRADNVRLCAEVAALTSDPRAVERIAREQLGLARPGELVFVLGEGPARPRR